MLSSLKEKSLSHPHLVYRHSVDIYAHRGYKVVVEEGNAQRSDMDALGMKYVVLYGLSGETPAV